MDAYPIFNQKRFGEVIRQWRRQEGYSNTASLSEAIETKTGVYIDKDTLIRIERGERLPDVGKYFAIILTLSGDSWREDSIQIMEESLNGRGALIELDDKLQWIKANVEGFLNALDQLDQIETEDLDSIRNVIEVFYSSDLAKIQEATSFASSIECNTEQDEIKRIELLASVESERRKLLDANERFQTFLDDKKRNVDACDKQPRGA